MPNAPRPAEELKDPTYVSSVAAMVIDKLFREGHADKHIKFYVGSQAFQKSIFFGHDQGLTVEETANEIVWAFTKVKWKIRLAALFAK